MKLLSVVRASTGVVIGLAVVIIFNLPSNAQSTTFYCGRSNSVPTTIARTSRGNVPVIRWNSGYFSGSGWNPQRRCQQVSARFQEYYDNGTLKYITTGRMNRQSVVCVASRKGSDCTSLLFTLKPGSNPGQTLGRLLNYRALAAGNALNESSGQRLYINMEEYINTAPIEVESSGKPILKPNELFWWDSK